MLVLSPGLHRLLPYELKGRVHQRGTPVGYVPELVPRPQKKQTMPGHWLGRCLVKHGAVSREFFLLEADGDAWMGILRGGKWFDDPAAFPIEAAVDVLGKTRGWAIGLSGWVAYDTRRYRNEIEAMSAGIMARLNSRVRNPIRSRLLKVNAPIGTPEWGRGLDCILKAVARAARRHARREGLDVEQAEADAVRRARIVVHREAAEVDELSGGLRSA